MPHGGENRRGSRNGASKLSAKQVKEIRNYARKGLYTWPELAEIYKVGYWTIRDIITGRTWAWLT